MTNSHLPENTPWSLVVIASRESLPTLLLTLKAASIAARQLASIEVLVNGNAQLASGLVDHLAAAARPSQTSQMDAPWPACRVWSIAVGDKANAWNQYLHRIWVAQSVVFFIDGYVRLNSDAISNLGRAMLGSPLALGGAGVPTHGRSAEQLRKKMVVENGLHGNFWCVRGSFLTRLRHHQFRLPVGLYRGDSLLGAVLSYDLDPGPNLWEDHRIAVAYNASWQTDPKHWWHFSDIQAFAKRKFRQIRGDLEIRAIREHLTFRRKPAFALPVTCRHMVLDWAEDCPDDLARALNCNPLAWLAMRKIRSEEMPDTASLEPVLAWTASVETATEPTAASAW